MQRTNLFTFFIFFIILEQNKCIEMVERLVNLCPMISTISEPFEQQKREYEKMDIGISYPSEEFPEFYNILNVRTLNDILFSGVKPVGEGTFGKVYTMKYFDPETREEKDSVAKVLRFESALSEKQMKKQKKLALEMEANTKVFKKENGKYFFPEIFSCIEFTDEVDKKSEFVDFENIGKQMEKNISHQENEGMVSIFTEKLTISMGNFLDLYVQNKIELDPEERLNAFYQASLGLKIMNSYFLHCDIKPDNMMLKNIEMDEIEEMNSKKILPIRLNQNEYYQIKYIDFGMIAPGKIHERECKGGTPGYIPDEYFENGTSNSKFDVYSLGMTFLEMELADCGYEGFNRIDAILFQRKKEDKGDTLTEKNKNDLYKIDLVNRMVEIIEGEEYREVFLNILEEIYPQLKEQFEFSNEGQNYLDMIPKNFLETNVYVFRGMMQAAVTVYFNEHFLKKKNPAQIESIDKKIKLIQSKVDKDEKNAAMLKVKIQYLENLKKITEMNGLLTVGLVNLYQLMILSDQEARIGLEEMLQKIQTLKDEYYSLSNEYLEEIRLYEDDAEEEEAIANVNLEMLASKIQKKDIQIIVYKKEVKQEDFGLFSPEKVDQMRHKILL